MGCCSNSKKIDQAILEKARGLINQVQLDYFYLTYNYTQDEIITVIDEFQKLNLNEKGLLYPEDLIDFPPFHFSPFGYHIFDALDLKVIDKKEELIDEKDEKMKVKTKSKKSDKNDDKITTGDKISDVPNMEKTQKQNSDGMVGIQDFIYYVYLFSSHVKLVEKAQLYFKLFDFDNDGKITPSDIIVYLENLGKDTDEVLDDTKKYLREKRKMKKEDFLSDIDEIKSADENVRIANLIIKEACGEDKNYLDFFDFRNMFLNMQFVPEYSNPLYLEELFMDDYRGQKKKKKKNEKEVIIPVKNDLDKSKEETEHGAIHED
jgi:Ca2+-binding EF-hand superfamily protein